jgi:PAS domain S-box-containing protein
MVNSGIGKILVVDDEVELKNILVEALTSQGYETSGFTSGEEALEALRDHAFDVLLTDLMMPGMNGISLLRASLAIDSHLIAIMMTGQGTIQTAVDAMKEGAFDYVLKPFRLQTVLPVLTRAMNTRHMRLENVQLREAVAIHELSETISFTLDPQTVLSKLADAALQQSEADEVSVLLPITDGDEFYIAAVRGEKRERLLGERVPFGESISSWVARQHEPVILNGEVNDDRFVALWPRPDISSSVSIPMLVAKKLVGVLNLNVVNRARPFTLGQLKALTILASTAAAALESASLYSQVQEAEENYHSIFENAIEGIFQTTPEGRFLTVNPAMSRILGYDSPEELIQKITDVAHQVYVNPEDRTEAARLEKETGILKSFEFEAFRKDGEKIWLSLKRHSVKDENGNELYREGSVEDITERRKAEEALKASEAEMRALFASMTDVIIVFDDQGRHLKIAPTKTPQIYKPAAERIGKTIHDIFPKEKADFFLAQIQQALAKGRTHRVEYSLSINDREFWYDGSISPMTEHSVIWVARDITERKHAEEERARLAAEIESQRQRLDNIVGTVPGVVWEAWGEPDAATQRIDFVSDYVEAMLGYSVEEWLATPNFWLQIVHPDDKERAAKAAAADFVSAKSSNTFEFRWVAKDGRILWVESNSVVLKDEEGRPVGVRGVTTDVTERKQSEEALRESEERYRDLVENAHDIIFSHDLDGNYTSVNRAGEQITGYTHEECLRLNIVNTIAPEYVNKAQEMMAKKLAGEKVTAYELEILGKDGKRVAVEVNTKLILKDEVPVGIQGIARDVTERKQLEEQLRQSQKMEAIGQLAGGVAHDFNNLLTAINGYSSLALQRLEDGHPVKSYLEEVKKAGDRATNLTRQLLAFGRKQILQPLALNLNYVVSDMNKMLRRLIGEDIELVAKLDPDLGKVMADPGQIEQVLVNLIVNARDAMPRGGNLTIETENVELDEEYGSKHVGVSPGKYVVLAVSDNGEGMCEEVRRKVFEPFFTTKEKGKGTGLGLSTVYGIVKQSGGNIWVYSEPGRGTTFKVYLPQVESRVKKPDEQVVESAPRGGTETILLVEDEEVVRGLARRILEQAGYSVVETGKAAEALHFCEEHAAEVNLLLTDVVMPEMSGQELAAQLKSQCPDLKTLFMSGYTDEAIVHHGVLDSCVEFIQKPFTPAALVRKVREVLDSDLVMSD